MNQLEMIATSIFKQYGVDFSTAKRAGGWTNATWLAGGLALRLSVNPGNDKIRREVQMAAMLPATVGYPANIATGVTEGYEWSISKEIPGINLSEAWSAMDWPQRGRAFRQIWEKALAVHLVELGQVEHLARKRAWYNSCDAEEASASMDRLAQQGLFAPRQGRILSEMLDRFWKALPKATSVLNHGDITMDNMLWYHGQVVSLMDFEYAVIAPAELDLNSMLKFVFCPETDNDSFIEVDQKGLQQFQQVVLDMVKPLLTHPNNIDLLLGYAILLEQYILELWLAHPEGEGPLEQWGPYRRLLSLADGHGGYLAPVLQIMV